MNNLNDLAPPPAYTEQEFDQKTSHALVVSSSHPQTHRQADDQWEVWDEAVFETNAVAAQARNQGSSGSSGVNRGSRRPLPPRPSSGVPLVQPLRIHKRNKSSGDNTNAQQRQSKSQEAGSSWTQKGPRGSSDEPQTDASPPPPFTAVDSPSENVVQLAYNPADSLPPSPLMPTIPEHHSPQTPQQHQPFSQQTYPQPSCTQQAYLQPIYPHPATSTQNPIINIHSQRMSTPPAAPPRTPPSQYFQQPSTTYASQQQSKPITPSIMTTLPAVQDRANGSHESPQILTFDASAFYNPAVSAHVPTSIPSPRPRQLQYVSSGALSSNQSNSSARQPRIIQSTFQPPTHNNALRPVQSATQLRPLTAHNFPMQHTSSGWNADIGARPYRRAASERGT